MCILSSDGSLQSPTAGRMRRGSKTPSMLRLLSQLQLDKEEKIDASINTEPPICMTTVSLLAKQLQVVASFSTKLSERPQETTPESEQQN